MDFTLNLLPPGGLSSSVITTVWVGVMVVTFFNLRFGTTLSGLVVPGYLIPLFIVHPVSGWVIIVESIITYFIARAVAERGLIRLGLGEMFGRDRFFMLILVSVLVRITSDGFILPILSDQLALWGVPYQLRSGLHSFGLIIIALCANQFWNGGFKIGVFSLSLYLLVTYAIVSYLLIPMTNFNISTLGYLYEDIASSILASPKAYIILITAAYISSRMNLRYGWDFNGILIPSLLALQWYDPFKILATFVEALIIYAAAQAVMKLPGIRNINIEGARQLLLFFNVGFVYKLILGYVIIYWLPQEKVTDYYGFGYVLGTLMAMKMYQKGIAIRFTRTTLQTSLVAVIVASVLGYSLTFFNTDNSILVANQITPISSEPSTVSLPQFIEQVRAQSYQSDSEQRPNQPNASELAQFRQLFKALEQIHIGASSSLSTSTLDSIASLANTLGYHANLVEQRYLVLHDATPERGWGIYVLDSQATSGLAIEVPRALDEPKAATVAQPLFSALHARYLSYAGARANRSEDGSDNVLLNAQSPLHLFHQVVANNNALQLRSFTRQSARQLLGVRQFQKTINLDLERSAIWVKRSLPADLSLQRLEQLLGQFDINWHPPTTQNRQRDTAIRGFVELYLNDDSLLNIFSQTSFGKSYQPLDKDLRIDGYLQSYLLTGQFDFADKYSDSYVVANKYQLIYFDQAVLQTTLDLIDHVQTHQWQEKHELWLQQVAQSASRFDYDLVLYRHIPTDQRYLIFKPQDQAKPRRHWGTYIIKLGAASQYIVEVPRPIYEQNTFEFGTQLFQSLDARALLISGAHPSANRDGSAQLTALQNPDSLFNLFHQSLLTHYADSAPFAVQVRGYAPDADEVINQPLVAHFEYQKPGASHHPALAILKQRLVDSGLQLAQPQSEQIDERFSAKLNLQSRFTRFIDDAQYAEVWLPSLLRQQFKRIDDDDQLAKKITALALPTQQVNIDHWLGQQKFMVPAQQQWQKITTQLSQFQQSENIEHLLQLSAITGKVQVLIDNNSQQYFMSFANTAGELLLIANLMPLNPGQNSQDINQFLDQRRHFFYREVKQ